MKPLVDKLTLSSNKLELILKNQNDFGNRVGIGYNSSNYNKISTYSKDKSILKSKIKYMLDLNT